MKAISNIKLKLSDAERRRLRLARTRIGEIPQLDPQELANLLQCSERRARELVFSANVQCFETVGPATVDDLLALGIRDMQTLAAAEPAAMYSRLNNLAGRVLDPCVEDQLRTTVAQARWHDLPDHWKAWWSWMPQRGKLLSYPS